MAKFSVRTDRKKCQSFGACAKAAPDSFVLDAEKFVEFKGHGEPVRRYASPGCAAMPL